MPDTTSEKRKRLEQLSGAPSVDAKAEPTGAPADTRKALEDGNEEERQAAQATIGATAPEATEPLTPDRIGMLAETTARAVEAITGGQVPLPPFERPTGDVDRIPPALYTPIVALSRFFQKAGKAGLAEAAAHQFDPAELGTSNDGLADLAARMDAIAGDQALIAAAKRPPSAAKEEPEPPTA